MSEKLTVTAQVNAPAETVWKAWTEPYHIMLWNHAIDAWHTTRASNDLKAGGKLLAHMAAKDGSFGFDFGGTYTVVEPNRRLVFVMGDDRMVDISFEEKDGGTFVTETFDAETTNPADLQRQGWQAILDNFKKHAESVGKQMTYSIYVGAAPEKVHDAMIGPESYKKWTSAFNPTSHFIGSWAEGTKMLFIGTDQDGNQGGMVSRIMANQRGRYISIQHLGEYKNGEEVTSGPGVESWAGAMENYTFLPEGAGTRVLVEMTGGLDTYADYFNATWPQALLLLKELCE